ncbi:MAG TPA: hypothetical protein VMJ70_05850 [Candidatus Sulfotelmatobacter sp.]|nr:hypothetical protein [Candidatus Sulfotelmatobacter sp.]
MPFQLIPPLRARLSLLAGLSLAVLCPWLAGCSKSSPAAPKVPGPTKFMVFSSDRGQPAGKYRNYFLTLDGASYAQYPASDTVIALKPSINSDNTTLAYEEDPATGYSFNKRVVLYNTDSHARTVDVNVNIPGANATEPYLSLDGAKLLFVRDTLGAKQLRLYDVVNLAFIPLPGLAGPPGTNDHAPACDAQAHRIVFVSDRNGNDDVFLYQLPTTSFIDIAGMTSPSEDREPCISGDGRTLAWSTDRNAGDGFDIMLADVNSLTLVPFTGNTTSDEMQPSLSHDGTNLLMVSDRPTGMGGLDVWSFNLITSTATEVTNQSSAGADILPVLVWP